MSSWLTDCYELSQCTLYSTGIEEIYVKTAEKAKVVASVWGADIFQCLAALAVLHSTI